MLQIVMKMLRMLTRRRIESENAELEPNSGAVWCRSATPADVGRKTADNSTSQRVGHCAALRASELQRRVVSPANYPPDQHAVRIDATRCYASITHTHTHTHTRLTALSLGLTR